MLWTTLPSKVLTISTELLPRPAKNQQPTLGVCSEMIDATRDIRRGNSLNQLERLQFPWCH
jgi:hypothetical protein